MAAKVRVPRFGMPFGGWCGRLTIVGETLVIVGDDGEHRLELDLGQVRRFSFNSNNGLWAFRMKDRTKVYLQTSGALLSAESFAGGRAATKQIAELLYARGGRGLSV